MALSDAILVELEEEAAATRAVLERVRAERLGWRAQPGAKTLGEVAHEVATLPAAIAGFIRGAEAAPAPRNPGSVAELLAAFTASVATATRLLSDMDDATLLSRWRLMHGGRELLALPRGALLSLLLQHWRERREQLASDVRALDPDGGLRNGDGGSAGRNPFAVGDVLARVR